MNRGGNGLWQSSRTVRAQADWLIFGGESGTEWRPIDVTQTQVTAHLSGKAGVAKLQAKSALDELAALIIRELNKAGSIRLAGLGIFRQRTSEARIGRNPVTGEQIKIPARVRLTFTPAKALNDKVFGESARHELYS